jgi:hypothetical protein
VRFLLQRGQLAPPVEEGLAEEGQGQGQELRVEPGQEPSAERGQGQGWGLQAELDRWDLQWHLLSRPR